jgi:hypothetical protein
MPMHRRPKRPQETFPIVRVHAETGAITMGFVNIAQARRVSELLAQDPLTANTSESWYLWDVHKNKEVEQ